jgi:hypothetical protein
MRSGKLTAPALLSKLFRNAAIRDKRLAFLVLILRISSSGARHGGLQCVDAFLIFPRHPAISHRYPDCAEPQHEYAKGEADPREEC